MHTTTEATTKTKTRTKTNSTLIEFSDGQRLKFKTTETIPEIREHFKIGKSFLLQDQINIIEVESITIY
jgi:hypothetical protein